MPAARRLTGTSGTGSISVTGTTAGGGTAPDLDGKNVVLVTDGDWSGDDPIYVTRAELPLLVAGLVDGEYIISNTDANPTPITVAAPANSEPITYLAPIATFGAQTDTPLTNSSVPFGTPHAQRDILIAVSTINNGSNSTISSATIGGVSAALVGGHGADVLHHALAGACPDRHDRRSGRHPLGCVHTGGRNGRIPGG